MSPDQPYYGIVVGAAWQTCKGAMSINRSQGSFDSIRWFWLTLSPSMLSHPITAEVRSLSTRPGRQVESPSDREEM